MVFPTQIDVASANAVDPTVVPVAATPTVFDVAGAFSVDPPMVQVRTPSLQEQGMSMARSVLYLIGSIALVFLGCVAFNEFSGPPRDAAVFHQIAVQSVASASVGASAPETLRAANDLLGRLNESRRSSREFWIAVGQFLLLNLLLPVLTSILGYAFGSTKA